MIGPLADKGNYISASNGNLELSVNVTSQWLGLLKGRIADVMQPWTLVVGLS